MVQIVMISTCTFIVLVQQKILKFVDDESEIYFINIGIPLALIFLSMACQVGFTAVTQSAYQDDRLFPFRRKATAINFIILLSKFCPIGVSFVNEIEEPIPIVVLIVGAILGLVLTLAFPSKKEHDLMDKDLQQQKLEIQ